MNDRILLRYFLFNLFVVEASLYGRRVALRRYIDRLWDLVLSG